MHDRIVRLFSTHFGEDPTATVELAGDGSERSYYRLISDDWQTAVGVIGPDADENRAFLSYSRAFGRIGLPVPEIYAADEEAGVWLESDLGDTTLFDALVEARGGDDGFPEAMVPVYRRIVRTLPRFQVEGGRVADYSVAYPRAAFDQQSILWDLNYFKYHFLKLAHIPFNEARLEHDFHELAGYLLRADTRHFLYRDFQSRNIMLQDDDLCFIDYQGGRRGAPQYDVASLLYDSKADIPDAVREDLLSEYLDALGEYIAVDRELFREHYRGYVIVRIMQAMGAYGYRGFFERKPHFLKSVPYAAQNIEAILGAGLPIRLPELETVFHRIVERWAGGEGGDDESPGLTVRVGSFSFKSGYPDDETGHGGGHIFDCRALPNPGRYLEYKTLSGRDEPVIDFLEQRREVDAFFGRTRALTDAQVREYLRRGFGSLTVGYGCTGGQHRSVYLSERLARHLREEFPQINVRVAHRERASWKSAPEAEREAAKESGSDARQRTA